MNIKKTNTEKQKNAQNVKSVGIKSIKLDGFEDVYNLEVKDNNNFAVNGGLIVHNCMDSFRYFVNTILVNEFDWLDWSKNK